MIDKPKVTAPTDAEWTEKDAARWEETCDKVILETKALRQRLATDIEEVINRMPVICVCGSVGNKRELAEMSCFSTLQKLREARMWLGMCLQVLNEENPYPHGNDPTTTKIDPPADMPDTPRAK